MPILVGIDGTGGGSAPTSGREATYDIEMANSFVHRLCTGQQRAKYIRGPVTLGGGLLAAIEMGVQFVVTQRKLAPREPVLLTGYSRGATGVVCIAKRLKNLNIRVQALMLFDCVDRHIAVDAHSIPNNVDYLAHVMRDPKAKSRLSFGNDGLAYSHPTKLSFCKHYMCTHGGMGGVPWKPPQGKTMNDYVDEGVGEALMTPVPNMIYNYHTNVTFAQDEAVSKQIWRDVQPFLTLHRF